MKKIIFTLMLSLLSVTAMTAQEQLKKVYNETIDRTEQINNAVAEAKSQGKYVICQVGGNWCPWCLRFADFITKDADLAKIVDDNFVYIHVNYPRAAKMSEETKSVMKRLGNPQRFGFPVFVLLRPDGSVLHIQDSTYLEQDKGYSKEKTAGFLSKWTPMAVEGTSEK
jgi:uncharacterized protein YyaL (SSP411 family)